MVKGGESKMLGKKRKYRKYCETRRVSRLRKMVTGDESKMLETTRYYRKYCEEEHEDNTEVLPGLTNDATMQLISTKFWLVFEAETRHDLRLTKILTRGESKVLGKKREYSDEVKEDNTQLLPGLPNYATVRLISTKLPWRTFHVLSSVSRAWLGAIRSGEIDYTELLAIRSGEIDYTELLPGLPNYVTVHLISTKLPWQTFHDLLSVNRAWLEAFRSGEIKCARVRSRAAETLAVIDDGNEMARYSLRDKAFYGLPPLPRFEYGCSCIITGAKIYMLGGPLDAKVWVLDVAGQQKWQECATMQTSRNLFGCAVFKGKIYIFGGKDGREQPIDSSEVYDPKVDAWTEISPKKSARIGHNAGVFRDEVLVHGGYVYDPDYYHGEYWRPFESSRDGMEAYSTAKDSWRTIPPGDFGKHEFRTNWWRPRRLGHSGKYYIRKATRTVQCTWAP